MAVTHDNFSVFLETVRSGATTRTAESVSSVNPQIAHRILSVLRESPDGCEVSLLGKRAGVDFFEFATALQTLQKLDAVIVEGQGAGQIARLGSKWQDVVSLLS